MKFSSIICIAVIMHYEKNYEYTRLFFFHNYEAAKRVAEKNPKWAERLADCQSDYFQLNDLPRICIPLLTSTMEITLQYKTHK